MNPNIYSAVRALLENDCSGHDWFHTVRVVNMAKRIAAYEDADMELTELAALLHDVDDVKLFGENSRNAVRIMQKYGYTQDVQNSVMEIIHSISFRGDGASVPKSLEGKIVQDADRLDAIGAVGIARAFAYGGSKGRIMHDPSIKPRDGMSETEYRSGNGTTLNHFYEKLLRLKELMNTQTAKAIAQERHDVMLAFLEEFYAEWDGKR